MSARTDTKLVIFELNEVPYKVLDYFVERAPSSRLASIIKGAAQFTALTPDTINLHPKISWQTFHRGVPDTTHGILEFNQQANGKDELYPRLLDILMANGVTVGCGASIGSYPLPQDRSLVSFWLPDVFAPSPETIPTYLSTFQDFNTRAVGKSARVVRKGLPYGSMLRLVGALPTLGVSVNTIGKIFWQALEEKTRSERIVRRRTLQGLLTFDVVLHHIEKMKPRVSTIFSNHVASSMHRYWAAAFPDDYEQNNMPMEWRQKFADEIGFAMRAADRMFGRLADLCCRDPSVKVLALASMGQHGIPHRVISNQVVIQNTQTLMDFLGFTPAQYKRLPGMEPLYNFEFVDRETSDRFMEAVGRIEISGDALQTEQLSERYVRLRVGRRNVQNPDDCLTVGGTPYPLSELGLALEEIQDLTGSTAQHTPDGICLVFDGHSDLSRYGGRREIDLTAVTASVLEAFSCPVPGYMPSPVDEVVSAISA